MVAPLLACIYKKDTGDMNELNNERHNASSTEMQMTMLVKLSSIENEIKHINKFEGNHNSRLEGVEKDNRQIRIEMSEIKNRIPVQYAWWQVISGYGAATVVAGFVINYIIK